MGHQILEGGGRSPVVDGPGVHHMALICSDVEQTVQFYQELIGFPLVELMENRDYAGSTHLFFDIGNDNLLAFFDFPGLGLKPGIEALGGVQHIAISTTPENLERVKASLDQQGVQYLGPDRGVTTSIYFKDPDGIQIELIAEPLRIMDGRNLG
jgi:glyoxylase I family protein